MSERLEFVFAGKIEKGIIEQVAIGEGNFVPALAAASTLVRAISSSINGVTESGCGIPVAAAILDLREDKLQAALVVGRGCASRHSARAPRRARYERIFG